MGPFLCSRVEVVLPWKQRFPNQQSSKLWGQEATFLEVAMIYNSERSYFHFVFSGPVIVDMRRIKPYVGGWMKHILHPVRQKNLNFRTLSLKVHLAKPSKGHSTFQLGRLLRDDGVVRLRMSMGASSLLLFCYEIRFLVRSNVGWRIMMSNKVPSVQRGQKYCRPRR